jgi:hypothetical protein
MNVHELACLFTFLKIHTKKIIISCRGLVGYNYELSEVLQKKNLIIKIFVWGRLKNTK